MRTEIFDAEDRHVDVFAPKNARLICAAVNALDGVEAAGEKPVPCPSCGSSNLSLPICMGEVWVKCLGCGKSGPMHATAQRAIAEWNLAAASAQGTPAEAQR